MDLFQRNQVRPFSIAHRCFLSVFVLAIALRLALFLLHHPFGAGSVAEPILNGSDAVGDHYLGMAFSTHGNHLPRDPFLSALRTPGYPLFIAAAYSLFGIKPWVVLLFQIVLDSVLAVLVAFLAAALADGLAHPLLEKGRIASAAKFRSSRVASAEGLRSSRIALAAGLLYAVDPFAVLAANELQSDSLFALLLFTAFLLFYLYWSKGSVWHLVSSALLLALSALVRPVALYMVVFAVPFILFGVKRAGAGPAGQRICHSLLYTVVFCLVLSPWLIRNRIVHGHFFLSTSPGYNTLVLYAAPVLARVQGTDEITAREAEKERLRARYGGLMRSDPYRYCQIFRQRGVQIIRGHPRLFVEACAAGILDLFFSIQKNSFSRFIGIERSGTDYVDSLARRGLLSTLQNYMRESGLRVILYTVFVLLLFLAEYSLALAGIAALVRARAFPLLIFLLLPVLYFVMITGPAGMGRFKLPFVPYYLILAAIGMMTLFRRTAVSTESVGEIDREL